MLALCAAAALLAAAPARGQDATSRDTPPEIPFAEWIAEPDRADLPWSIDISPPKLSILQRQVVEFRVKVPAKALHLLGPTYQLFLEVHLKDAEKDTWLDLHNAVGTRLMERMPRQSYLEFTMAALVRPGSYMVGFVLFDRVSGKRSVATRSLKVRPVSGDPLPEIARNVPAVEFFQRSVDQEREALPEIKSHLWLPVTTRRPVQIELLVNFAPSDPAPGPLGMSGLPESAQHNAKSLLARHQRTVAQMLGIVKVFSQMQIPNGSLHITAMDVVHREVFFEQDAVRELDWPRLRTALDQLNPLSIPVQALAGRRQNAQFFCDVLQRRLSTVAVDPPDSVAQGAEQDAHASNGGGNGGGNGGAKLGDEAQPLRVYVVVSAPVIFERGSDLSPATAPRGAEYRVYHLDYRFGGNYIWDDLPRLLRPLEPRRFELQTAEDFRRAIARLLADLKAL